MTLHAICIPKWGLAMEEGTLASWLKAEGSTVRQGEDIAEFETSKIANVLEAPAAGILRRRIAAEGDVRPVGALIGVLADAGEDDEAVDIFVAGFSEASVVQEQQDSSTAIVETILVDGLPARFLRVRARTASPATPLVLLHGFGGDHMGWMFNQDAWAADRDVLALDLPGHGGSTKDVGDGELATLAARVSAWLDSQRLDRIHIVGHSLGAAVAASLALASPARVKSIVALCGAGFGDTLSRDYVEGFIAASRRKELKPVIEMLFADPGLVTRDMLESLMAYKRIDGVGDALRALAEKALAAPALAELRSELADIQVPMLALYGAADRIVTISDPAAFPWPHAIVEAAGHMPHMEAAKAVNEQVAGFLALHDGSERR